MQGNRSRIEHIALLADIEFTLLSTADGIGVAEEELRMSGIGFKVKVGINLMQHSLDSVAEGVEVVDYGFFLVK